MPDFYLTLSYFCRPEGISMTSITVSLANETRSLLNTQLCFIVIKCIKIQRPDLVPTEICTLPNMCKAAEIYCQYHIEIKLQKMMTSH